MQGALCILKVKRPDGEPGYVFADSVQWMRPTENKHGQKVVRVYFKDNLHEQDIQSQFQFMVVSTNELGLVKVATSDPITIQ